MPDSRTAIRKTLRGLFAFLAFAALAGCTAPASPAAPTETPAPPSATSPPNPTASLTPLPSPTASPSALPTHGPQSGLPSAGDPYTPELGNTGYDVLHYDLALSLNPGETFIEGTAELTLTSLLENLVEFSLDFSGLEIQSLSINGLATPYRRDGDKLFVLPAAGLAAGQPVELQITYRGFPEQDASEFLPFFHHVGLQFLGRSAFAYNQPDGAHFWFPCNDHPTDKASYTFEITVPAGMMAVANGRLTGVEEQEKTSTFFWEMPQPMATYLAMVAIGEYEIVEAASPAGIPIVHYIYDDIRPEFEPAASVTGEALDWMSANFGPYPYESFGFAVIRLIRASLETQGNAILSEEMLNEETVVHEIVHMWFGDWVTMASWADMWHNEGFAEYVTMMWFTRDHPAAIDIFMQNVEGRVSRESSPDPLGNLSPNLLFGFDSYQRGALMVHELRKLVGEEVFFSTLRLYLERFGGGTASRQDFQAIFEETSGMDLGEFFTTWLE